MSSNTPLRCTLPSDVGRWVRREARRGGWRTPGAYLTHLVRDAQADLTLAEIEEKVLEALDDGPGKPISPAEWNASLERALAEGRRMRSERSRRNGRVAKKGSRRAA